MVYYVIGIMSGSSLDGLDVAYVRLEEVRGKWSYEILHAECTGYNESWMDSLRRAADINIPGFLRLHTRYGAYIGDEVRRFIHRHDLAHKVHFIASHGHTVFHDPAHKTTCQIGDGAAIAAATALPVVSDLRAMDIALSGQGAPIVPIGDKLLFEDYDYLLNIGGIANITTRKGDGNLIAFDVCAANQALNALAEREGKPMDEGGAMAASGSLIGDVLEDLNAQEYYKLPPPKSLSNEMARDLVFPKLFETNHRTKDLLNTVCEHIAGQIAEAIKQNPAGKEQATLLATGGGAFNSFLMSRIREVLQPHNVSVTIPDDKVIKFKEALVMALIGTLRWREEVNVLSSVTGASRDSVGGALWLG